MLGPDRLLSLSEAARHLRKTTGLAVSPVSLWRWIRVGVGDVKLESRAFGRRLFTTPIMLDNFGKACSVIPLRKRKPRAGGDGLSNIDIDARLEELRETHVSPVPKSGRRVRAKV